jgi:hypothetical protein
MSIDELYAPRGHVPRGIIDYSQWRNRMIIKRNHRVFGVVRSEQDAYTILETEPNQFAAARTDMLLPASSQDIAFEIRMELAAAIERARFLGVPDDALRGLLEEELRAPEAQR